MAIGLKNYSDIARREDLIEMLGERWAPGELWVTSDPKNFPTKDRFYEIFDEMRRKNEAEDRIIKIYNALLVLGLIVGLILI